MGSSNIKISSLEVEVGKLTAENHAAMEELNFERQQNLEKTAQNASLESQFEKKNMAKSRVAVRPQAVASVVVGIGGSGSLSLGLSLSLTLAVVSTVSTVVATSVAKSVAPQTIAVRPQAVASVVVGISGSGSLSLGLSLSLTLAVVSTVSTVVTS